MLSLGIVALIVVLMTMASWFWRAYRVDIPKSPKAYMFILFGSLALGVAAVVQEPGVSAASWAIGLSAMMLYLLSTGAQKTSNTMVRVGTTIPAFISVDDSGDAFDSTSLTGSRLLIKFFRGHW
jgi:tellurite resistance protein TehA-like permease